MFQNKISLLIWYTGNQIVIYSVTNFKKYPGFSPRLKPLEGKNNFWQNTWNCSNCLFSKVKQKYLVKIFTSYYKITYEKFLLSIKTIKSNRFMCPYTMYLDGCSFSKYAWRLLFFPWGWHGISIFIVYNAGKFDHLVVC